MDPDKLKHCGRSVFGKTEHASAVSLSVCEFVHLETVSTIVSAIMIVAVFIIVTGYTIDLAIRVIRDL